MVYKAEIQVAEEFQTAKAFDLIRWHGINYLLREGQTISYTPAEIPKGSLRPNCKVEEEGTGFVKDIFYSFHISAKVPGKERMMNISLKSEKKEALEEMVKMLTKDTIVRASII